MGLVYNQLALLVALLSVAWLQSAPGNAADDVTRRYAMNAALISYLPDKGIEEYQGHGSGSSTGLATLGFGARIDGISAVVEIAQRVEEGRFLVTVDLDSDEAKRALKFETQTLDLTNLRPTAVPIATVASGRVYQLNLTPSVRVIDKTPRRLDVSELQLHHWRFPSSPILVNDAVYVGRISCAQSPVAFVDISGIARVEFSLYQLSGAEPWGTLDEGVVTLTHPRTQTKIEISNAKNGGRFALELPGGPYRVWVRWSPPTVTVEEHWDELRAIRERILNGEIADASTSYLDKQLAREPSPWIYSSGLRQLREGERVDVE